MAPKIKTAKTHF